MIGRPKLPRWHIFRSSTGTAGRTVWTGSAKENHSKRREESLPAHRATRRMRYPRAAGGRDAAGQTSANRCYKTPKAVREPPSCRRVRVCGALACKADSTKVASCGRIRPVADVLSIFTDAIAVSSESVPPGSLTSLAGSFGGLQRRDCARINRNAGQCEGAQ